MVLPRKCFPEPGLRCPRVPLDPEARGRDAAVGDVENEIDFRAHGALLFCWGRLSFPKLIERYLQPRRKSRNGGRRCVRTRRAFPSTAVSPAAAEDPDAVRRGRSFNRCPGRFEPAEQALLRGGQAERREDSAVLSDGFQARSAATGREARAWRGRGGGAIRRGRNSSGWTPISALMTAKIRLLEPCNNPFSIS